MAVFKPRGAGQGIFRPKDTIGGGEPGGGGAGGSASSSASSWYSKIPRPSTFHERQLENKPTREQRVYKSQRNQMLDEAVQKGIARSRPPAERR